MFEPCNGQTFCLQFSLFRDLPTISPSSLFMVEEAVRGIVAASVRRQALLLGYARPERPKISPVRPLDITSLLHPQKTRCRLLLRFPPIAGMFSALFY